jgi:hypothetical protein
MSDSNTPNDSNDANDSGVTGASPIRNILRIIVAVIAIGVIIACAINIYGKLKPAATHDDDHTPPASTVKPKPKPAPTTKPAAKPTTKPAAATTAAAAVLPPQASSLKLKKAQIDNLSILVFEEFGNKVDMLAELPPNAVSPGTSMDNFPPKNDSTTFPVNVLRTKFKDPTELDLDVVAQSNITRHLKTLGDKNAKSEIRKISVDGKDARQTIITGQGKTGPVVFQSVLIQENPTTTWLIQVMAFEGKEPNFPSQVIESIRFAPPVNP